MTSIDWGAGTKGRAGEPKRTCECGLPILICCVYVKGCISFSKQLRKEYGANVLPAFPPKKLFSLTPAEVEQRREQLEKYMQAGEWLEGTLGWPC